MSTTAQTMQSESPPSSVSTDYPTSNHDSNGGANHTESEKLVALDKMDVVNMSSTLEQILDVLRGSTIAEERGKGVDSKFWATYKRVSNEHDDDFLERANDDMGIILTFAGLFSAVNSTFIVGMQPNPGDTTNALMVQLIRITANPNAEYDISNLSSSTSYSSSIAWTQALAYASLVFSVLAAFGAVMGKQWLNSYKAARERGSLEERGMTRQWKLDRLESWHLKAVLKTFLILLQISLLLFALSLSATMWFQQRQIFYVVISTMGSGMLFFVVTHVGMASKRSFSGTSIEASQKIISGQPYDPFIKSSAVRWILETSTNPEVIDAAAAMVLRVQWPAALDVSAAYTRLLDNFKAYHDTPERCVNYGKAMAHLCIQPVKIHSDLIKGARGSGKPLEGRGSFVRDAFMAGRLAWYQFRDAQEKYTHLDCKEAKEAERHKADVHTALRTMVIHGRDNHLSRPDDEGLIWYGNLRWWRNEGLSPSCEDFDWLVDYVMAQADDETKGDALLALSALGSFAERDSYVTTLIHCMGHTERPRTRYAALRVVLDARVELARPANNFDASLLDKLSLALLTAVDPNNGKVIRASDSDPSFHYDRDRCYFRLIFALTTNGGWRVRLARDGHVKRCISLADNVLDNSRSSHNFYLAGIFLHIVSSGGDSPSTSLGMDRWRKLVKEAWSGFSFVVKEDMHTCLEVLPALVEATKEHFQGRNHGEPIPGLPDRTNGESELNDLTVDVKLVLKKLRKRPETPDQEDGPVDVIQAVQGLYQYLSTTVHPNPSPDNPGS